MPTDIWCAGCLAELGAEPCGCGGEGRRAGGPGEHPVVIGHLALLDSAPPPRALLEGVCVGPLRVAGSGPFRAVSQRHNGRTVWMWRASYAGLPDADTGGDPAFWRLLGATTALLLDAPQGTPLFAAQHARSRGGGEEPPELADMAARLSRALEFAGARVRILSLHDPGEEAREEDLNRLSSLAPVRRGRTYPEAITHLLPDALTAPRRWVVRFPLASDNVTKAGDSKVAPEFRIVTADIGGAVARHMIVRLHVRALRSARARKRRDTIDMGGRRFTITARPTPEGVEIAEFYEQTAEAEPPIGFQASRWEGRFGKVFRRKHDVAVELHPGSGEAPGAPLILGVGPYRTLGEAELAELIEAVWEDRFVVAAIVTHSKCDAHLLAWAQSEFRGIQTYPDTWEGNLAAIESILAMTGN